MQIINNGLSVSNSQYEIIGTIIDKVLPKSGKETLDFVVKKSINEYNNLCIIISGNKAKTSSILPSVSTITTNPISVIPIFFYSSPSLKTNTFFWAQDGTGGTSRYNVSIPSDTILSNSFVIRITLQASSVDDTFFNGIIAVQ